MSNADDHLLYASSLANRPILVIDDNEAVRTAFEVLLSLHGARVLGAASPAEGLAALQSKPVDLVIQDMNFRREATTGEEGIALFREIRQRVPGPADHSADRLDPPGNRGRAGQGRRRRLRRQALGRRAAAHHGAQPARPAQRTRGSAGSGPSGARRARSWRSASTCAASSTRARRCTRSSPWRPRSRTPMCRC